MAKHSYSVNRPYTAPARLGSPSPHLRLLRARHPQIARCGVTAGSETAALSVKRQLCTSEFEACGVGGRMLVESSSCGGRGTPQGKHAWKGGPGTPSTSTPNSTDSADSDPGDVPHQRRERLPDRRLADRREACAEDISRSERHPRASNVSRAFTATSASPDLMSPASVIAKIGPLTADERCPHCARMFSAEAAVRHVPICANIRSRPKPPAKQISPSYTDVLGRRRKSKLGIGVGFTSSSGTHTSPGFSREAAPAEHGDPRLVALSNQWGQLEFLLCNCLDALADEAAVAETLRSTERCLAFIGHLEGHAARLGMRKGQLSRLLLPFDENTDSNKQASSASALGSGELDGKLSDEVRRELVSDAILLRGLVRVKVADCADAEQALQALRLVAAFLKGLQKYAEDEGRTTTAVLRDL